MGIEILAGKVEALPYRCRSDVRSGRRGRHSYKRVRVSQTRPQIAGTIRDQKSRADAGGSKPASTAMIVTA
jgi:hypothetical protein